MTGAPLFPDCCFPDACECAARGYGPESHDRCLVPGVVDAAERLGRPHIAALVRREPIPLATPFGTMQPLRRTPNGLAADVLHAMEVMGADFCRYSTEQLDKILRYEKASAGLRAEAGYSGGVTVILHTHVERLTSGAVMMVFLTLGCTGGSGDAMWWMVAVRGMHDAVNCARHDELQLLLKVIRAAAGGRVEVLSDEWTLVPTDEELSEFGAL